jgi:hypothetical protein
MANPLNASTNNSLFSTGDILPGISFTSSRDHAEYTSPDLLVWAGSNNINGHIVLTNHAQEKLIIEFTDDNVTAVSMKLLTIFTQTVTFDIKIYDNSQILLGETKINGGTPVGTYFGVQSETPIKKITIYGFDYVNYGEEAEGVDDVMFGTCNSDSDGDGCFDADDAVVNSNMEEFVNIDGCSNGVPNKLILSATCGTMMSDVIDGLEKGTYKNHGEFLKEITKVVSG